MKKLRTLLPTCIVLVGLLIMGYPAISKKVNAGIFNNVIRNYEKNSSGCSPNQRQEVLQKAIQYNESLSEKSAQRDVLKEVKQMSKEEKETYKSLLNVNEDGIMGYLEIPCISVKLPIYHGTEDETMQKGVGHMINTSFPIRGKSVHSVLSSHTGMSDASLFDRLTEVKEGDLFYVHILDEVTEYKVDAIHVVLPDDFSKLRIEEGKEYVTLLTCTPYGVNSHRLLVRGSAVRTVRENDQDSVIEKEQEKYPWKKYAIVAGICVLVLLGVIFIWQSHKR